MTVNVPSHRNQHLMPGHPLYDAYHEVVTTYGLEDLGNPEATWRALDQELRVNLAGLHQAVLDANPRACHEERKKNDERVHALYAEHERKSEPWELLRILTGRELPTPDLPPPPDAEPFDHLRWRCIQARVAYMGRDKYLKARAALLAEEKAAWALEQQVQSWFEMLEAVVLAELKKRGVPNEVPYPEVRDGLCEALRRLHEYFSLHP